MGNGKIVDSEDRIRIEEPFPDPAQVERGREQRINVQIGQGSISILAGLPPLSIVTAVNVQGALSPKMAREEEAGVVTEAGACVSDNACSSERLVSMLSHSSAKAGKSQSEMAEQHAEAFNRGAAANSASLVPDGPGGRLASSASCVQMGDLSEGVNLGGSDSEMAEQDAEAAFTTRRSAANSARLESDGPGGRPDSFASCVQMEYLHLPEGVSLDGPDIYSGTRQNP